MKLWFVLRHYGVEGLQSLIRHHVRLAERFAELVRNHPRLECTVPRSLALVCFHHVDGDEATRAMLEGCNDTGRMYMSHTRLGDRYVARMSIGQWRVEDRHIDEAWSIISEQADRHATDT